MRVFPDSSDENPLKIYFEQNTGKIIHKWHHYFDIYHNHFRRFLGRPVKLLEIGVNKGGSLQMWKHYFGPQVRIYGVDIEPRCKTLEEPQIEIFIGDQGDRQFLKRLREQIGAVDILIDDGGHEMEQQIVTFEELYGMVDEDGVYLVEDLHTSYREQWHGGLNQPSTFIERAKRMIDSLHSWHHNSPDTGPDALHKTATGLHFYPSVLVIEKCPSPEKLVATKTGYNPFRVPASGVAPKT